RDAPPPRCTLLPYPPLFRSLERAEVRAEVVADRGRLQLGPVLHEPRQGGDERDLEDGQLLRNAQGRLHDACAVRQDRVGEDEGRSEEHTFELQSQSNLVRRL